MTVPQNSFIAASHPRLVGRFVAFQALLWMLAAPVLGAAVHALAVWVQDFRAPLLIFPLLVGCGLGLLLVGADAAGAGRPPRDPLERHHVGRGSRGGRAALLQLPRCQSSLDRGETARHRDRTVPAFQETTGPDTSTDFTRFMRRQAARGRPVTAEFNASRRGRLGKLGTGRPADAPATLTIVYLACRAPYCCVCRSWYRTTRAGPLDADTAGRLAEAAVAAHRGTTRRRPAIAFPIASSGCGPGRLELACRRPAEDQGRGSMALGRPARASGAGAGRGMES